MISIETQQKLLMVMQAKYCSVLSRNCREQCQHCESLCSLTYFLYKTQNCQNHVILPTENFLAISNLYFTMYEYEIMLRNWVNPIHISRRLHPDGLAIVKCRNLSLK